ncbi:hypothetical protein L249_7636 [Ophiocordyceps polyrhachis-furcata BCC 54312]|uniref:Uncharacterized protein n=1 Tax=Ophiocordyceps polyrhachis-furcata BCC 54312 TaxID=1330021 RepID=A0A367LBA2_9HYPO|nr:hypothetical protein L249_7636 [Ophiocordyceps polyrhachis-furcata BCC 54312]
MSHKAGIVLTNQGQQAEANGPLPFPYEGKVGLLGISQREQGKVLCHVPAAPDERQPSCSRVSCSWNQAIFLCNNDSRMSFTVSCLYPSYFARVVSNKCRVPSHQRRAFAYYAGPIHAPPLAQFTYHAGSIPIPKTKAFVQIRNENC